MCYWGTTNGGGCSRVTSLLAKVRERNTTMYLHSEEYKAGFWVTGLLHYSTKIIEFLSQPGNSCGRARLSDTHLQPSTQLGGGFHSLLHSGVLAAERSKIITISPFSTSNATLCTCCFSKAPRVRDCQAGGHSFTEEWKSQTWGLLWMS